ncbi:MAG TPA: DegV family protein [Clostridium sp.]|nr:DegV family protein [Clostridium sp.]
MIRIISDSSTLLSIEEGKKKHIDIAPLSVTINGKTYRENEDITTKEFIDIINEGHLPISSQPSVGEVLNLYEKYPDDEIIHISMADGLSGAYNSACMAKNMCEHSENIEVMNARTLCMPHRYAVECAAKMVDMGMSKDEIIMEVNKLIDTSKSYLIPKDFNYLVRGGRLSPLVGRIAGLINLVPVVTLSEDSKRLDKFTTARTMKKALSKICDDLIEAGVDDSHNIFITHAYLDEDTLELIKKIISERIPNAYIEINILGPVFTTQGGPECVTIQTIKKWEK